MLYSKKKDNDPVSTVKNIKNIFDRIGLFPLKEKFLERKTNLSCVFSVYLYLENDLLIYSNGKSTNKEYALASAYGELIERIQNAYFIPYKAVDSKQVSLNELIDSGILDYYIKDKYKKEYMPYIIAQSANYNKESDKTEIDLLPFFHLNTKTVKYLPVSFIKFLSHSTGCCSGNTREEALVEGLSEIFERYVNKKAISDNISFPDIPEDVYIKYDDLALIIKYLKENQFCVRIKDASLNGQFPVVCLYLKKNNFEYIHFGSHPSLPIAIERCLTETFQGFDLSDDKVVYSKFRKVGAIHNNNMASRIDNGIHERFVEINESFYNEKPDYEFSYDNWSYSDNKNNKELVDILIKKLLDHNYNVFIRDVSFLGHPSYQIFIPELMSCFTNDKLYSGIKQRFNYYKCNNVISCSIKSEITPVEFIDFCEYFFRLKRFSNNGFYRLELYYVAALVHNKNYEKALSICNFIKGKKYSKRLIDIITQIILLLKENKDKKEINKIIFDKIGYLKTKILYDIFISNDSFINVISILKRRNTFYLFLKSEEIINRRNLIFNNILKEYKSNLPSQLKLFDLI